ncbi:MAG: hypothetical protein RLY20_2949 [Verrucomicrobiota bacterium]|jgi:hypothetical protein
MKTWIDLVLDNGEIVRVELPEKFEDDVREDIDNALHRRDWWAVRCYDGVSAEFMGMKLDRVNMARVVAML